MIWNTVPETWCVKPDSLGCILLASSIFGWSTIWKEPILWIMVPKRSVKEIQIESKAYLISPISGSHIDPASKDAMKNAT